jgi:hypothetical protein
MKEKEGSGVIRGLHKPLRMADSPSHCLRCADTLMPPLLLMSAFRQSCFKMRKS